MADRRRQQKPSRADRVLSDRIAALEARVEELKAEVDRNRKAFLEALARIPGARGSMPPPKL